MPKIIQPFDLFNSDFQKEFPKKEFGDAYKVRPHNVRELMQDDFLHKLSGSINNYRVRIEKYILKHSKLN